MITEMYNKNRLKGKENKKKEIQKNINIIQLIKKNLTIEND